MTDRSLYIELFLVGAVILLTLVASIGATVIFVRLYRKEQREKIVAKKLANEKKAAEQAAKSATQEQIAPE